MTLDPLADGKKASEKSIKMSLCDDVMFLAKLTKLLASFLPRRCPSKHSDCDESSFHVDAQLPQAVWWTEIPSSIAAIADA